MRHVPAGHPDAQAARPLAAHLAPVPRHEQDLALAATRLAPLVIDILDQVFGAASALSPDHVRRVVALALARVAPDGSACVVAHPDDCAALGSAPALRPEPAVARGGVRVEGESSDIDARVDVQLLCAVQQLLAQRIA